MIFAFDRARSSFTRWIPFAAIFLACGICEARQLNVAVNDLTARGVNKTDAEIIGDRLRSELVGTGRFRVMERTEMDKILKEQAFQQSGGCDQSECAVEIGKLLSVDRMVVGAVGKIGDLYSLQARLLDVQTGEIVFTATQDYAGRIEDVLTDAVPQLAQKLANGALTGIGGKGKADLYVVTSEPGAAVAIDGEKQTGTTPLSIEGLTPGEHMVTVTKGTLYGSQLVNLGSDDVQKIRIEMRTGFGSLKISTTPQGAQARLEDGSDLGETPLRVDRIPAGDHRLTLSREGYMPFEQNLSVGVGDVVPLKANLVPAGALALHADSMVSIRARNSSGDERELRTDGVVRMLPAGRWYLRLASDRLEPWSEDVDVVQGASQTRRVSLVPRFGSISLSSNPEAEGSASGSPFRTPWYTDALTPGEYEFKLSAPSYADTTFRMRVKRGETNALWIQMRHDQAWMDSVSRVARRKVRRNLGVFQILGSIGCGVGGYFMHSSASEHKANADAAVSDYRAARTGFDAYRSTYDSEIDEANSAQTTALWLDAASAALMAGAVYTLWF